MRYLIVFLLSLPLWLKGQAPQWTAPDGNTFNHSANITAVLELDGQQRLNANDQLAAFAGDEIRGKGMAVSLNGKVLHFMTVFSNVPTGEAMELRAYMDGEDAVYTAIGTYTFNQSSVTGSADQPYTVALSSDGDLLISMDSIPAQARLQGLPFLPVPLRDYLNQADSDPVSWMVSSSSYFQHTVTGDTLFLAVTDSAWTGTDTLTITATEQTANAYSASQKLALTVEPGISSPVFDTVPVQSVLTGQVFPALKLSDYENGYTGDCLRFGYQPQLETGMPEQQASWVIGGAGWPHTMSLLAKSVYTPANALQAEADQLGAFINGELRGAASPQMINGERVFIMQIYHTDINGDIEFRYYSDALKQIFVEPDTFHFVSGGQLGTPGQPQVLDFSPLSYSLDTLTGELLTDIRVPGWEGVETVRFTASDCAYPAELQDTVVVQFCSGPDTDGDGLCDQLDPDPDDACNPDPLNGACDADGDGVFADVDPDDEDPCNPLLEVEVLSAAGPSCPDALDGHLEIGLTTPYCTGGRFDVYLEEPSQPAQQLGSGQLLPDTFRVESLGEGHYQLRVELSEAGSCTYSSSCFPYTVDSLAVLSSQDSLAPSLTVDAGQGTLPASDTLYYYSETERCGVELSWEVEVEDNCTAPPLEHSVSCADCSDEPTVQVAAGASASQLSLFAGVGTNNLELWATDADSNSTVHRYVLIVQDTISPAMQCAGLTAYLDSDGFGSIGIGDIDAGSTDACGIDSLYLSETMFGCGSVGENEVVLTGIDPSGNSAMCTATVEVQDTISPAMQCAGLTVYLDSDGFGSIGIGDIDAGSTDACGIDSLYLSKTMFGCGSVGINEVVLTGIDPSGNSAVCMATVEVQDTIAPVMQCQNQTVSLSTFGSGVLSAQHVNGGSSDACGPLSFVLSQTQFSCGDVGVQTVTLTGTDANGNSSSCHAEVLVKDDVAPSISCNSPEVLIGYEGSYELTVGDVYAGGFDACGIDTVYHDGVPYSCEDIGMVYEVQVTAIDGSGNESSCVSLVSVGQSVSLPPEWSVSGLSGSPGSADWDICTGNGLLGLSGAGVHSSTGGDSYLFVHQPFCASKGGLQLDLESVSSGGYIGLSARRSLSADAAMVGLFWNGSGVLRWEVRSEDGGERSVVLLDAPNAKKIRLEYFNETWRARYQLEGGGGWLNLGAVPMAQPAGSCFEAGVGGFSTDPFGAMSGTVSRVRVVVLEQQLWSPPVTGYEGIDENGFVVLPNPVSNLAWLQWEKPVEAPLTITVLNQFGQMVRPPVQVPLGATGMPLDLGGLPTGMYYLRSQGADFTSTFVAKMIKR
ncbi:MAG: T9SS type A sorting domain-containing protein [bacterium]|nr:T9SS type A sorting domain-containing protein [bacterium]